MTPKFDPSRGAGESGDDDKIVVPEAWLEPRCHVCQSQYRRAIDRMIALGTGSTEISRIFGGEIDRRSITNHGEKHLAYREAAIRQIIQAEASAAEVDADQGISGVVKRKVYLETALHKALENLLGDRAVIEPKDALAIIDALNKYDQHSAGTQLDEIKLQFAAFLQAIREISAQRGDPTLGSDILIRGRQIIGVESKQLDS